MNYFIKNFKGFLIYYLFINPTLDEKKYNKFKEIFNQKTNWTTQIHNLNTIPKRRESDIRLEKFGTFVNISDSVISLKQKWIILLKKYNNVINSDSIHNIAEFKSKLSDTFSKSDDLEHIIYLYKILIKNKKTNQKDSFIIDNDLLMKLKDDPKYKDEFEFIDKILKIYQEENLKDKSGLPQLKSHSLEQKQPKKDSHSKKKTNIAKTFDYQGHSDSARYDEKYKSIIILGYTKGEPIHTPEQLAERYSDLLERDDITEEDINVDYNNTELQERLEEYDKNIQLIFLKAPLSPEDIEKLKLESEYLDEFKNTAKKEKMGNSETTDRLRTQINVSKVKC